MFQPYHYLMNVKKPPGMPATPSEKHQRPSPRRLTRRAFLFGCVGGLGLSGGGLTYVCGVEPLWAKMERVPLDLPDPHPDLIGLRIVQLSDLHVAPNVPTDFLLDQARRVTALRPDLIVITGDCVTRGCDDFLADLARIAAALEARLGVFAVLGNHDYDMTTSYLVRPPGPAGLARAARVAETLGGAGVVVLRNECRRVPVGGGVLQLVGLEDYWSGQFNAAAAFADVDPRLPCLALSHNPDSITHLKDQPCDWVLSGHTHGGQVRLPLLGAPVLPVIQRQYDQGRFEVGGTRLYVNRGLGYLARVRFNCRPEITVFTGVRRV